MATAGLVGQYPISTFVTPVNGASPIDANTVRGNDNTIATAYDSHDSDPTIHFQSSTLAARPAFGTLGRKWLTSDGLRIYYDTGSAWSEVAYLPLASGGTVAGTVTATRLIASANISASVAPVIASDGTTRSSFSFARVLGLGSSYTTAQTSGDDLGIASLAVQTVATTGGAQGIEGYSSAIHTSGTVNRVIGAIGNAEVAGIGGTVTSARGVQGGGLVSDGTATKFSSVFCARPGISGTGVITTLIGLEVENMTGGTTNYAIKCNGGRVALVLPTSAAGLATGDLWNNAGVVSVA